MADAKGVIGNAWGVPVQGIVVNLTSADVSSIIASASGLAKGLFWVGGGALAIALATVGLFAFLPTNMREKNKNVLPWGSLAKVDIMGKLGMPLRSFRGVCLTDEIILSSDNHMLNVPVDYIKRYRLKTENHGFIKKRKVAIVDILLFDESLYSGILIQPNEFEFLTPIGKQVVNIDSDHNIVGCTVDEVDNFRKNIDDFLVKEAIVIENFLGVEQFNRFFVRS